MSRTQLQKIVVTDYNLPVGDIDATKDTIAALLKNDKYIHICQSKRGAVSIPFCFLITDSQPCQKKPDFSKPYLHQSIVDILRSTVFNTCTSVGMRNLNLFQSNNPDHDRPEVPHALIALVATMVSDQLPYILCTHPI
jgi:hypothetical protein